MTLGYRAVCIAHTYGLLGPVPLFSAVSADGGIRVTAHNYSRAPQRPFPGQTPKQAESGDRIGSLEHTELCIH